MCNWIKMLSVCQEQPHYKQLKSGRWSVINCIWWKHQTSIPRYNFSVILKVPKMRTHCTIFSLGPLHSNQQVLSTYSRSMSSTATYVQHTVSLSLFLSPSSPILIFSTCELFRSLGKISELESEFLVHPSNDDHLGTYQPTYPPTHPYLHSLFFSLYRSSTKGLHYITVIVLSALSSSELKKA